MQIKQTKQVKQKQDTKLQNETEENEQEFEEQKLKEFKFEDTLPPLEPEEDFAYAEIAIRELE